MLFPIGDDNRSRLIVPYVTYILIGINFIMFFLELAGGETFILRWSFIPARFLADPEGQAITIFSSMFMHAGWLHILGNMLYLFIFGDNVEDRFGHFKFLIFYLLCGTGATFAQLAFSTDSVLPHLGASGAIAGVLRYLLMFPFARELCAGIFHNTDASPDSPWILDSSATTQRNRNYPGSRGRQRDSLYGTYRGVFYRPDTDASFSIREESQKAK